MPPYTPPPQVDVRVESNVLRPDGRNSVRSSAEFLTGTTGLSISRTDYANPSTAATQFEVEFELSPSTTATVGAAISEGGVVPAFSISQVVLDGSDRRLELTFARGLNDDDSRAVAALIQQNVVGATLRIGDVQNRFSVAFNSDGIEVYENSLSIPLTDDGFLQLNSYMRAASGESDSYWSPDFWSGTGVQIAVPIVRSEDLDFGVGIQPGLIYRIEDGSQHVALAAPVGTRLNYRPSDSVDVNAALSFSYGLNASLSVRWRF